MKTIPNYPQCHQDRKAQKLLDRIDKKLREIAATQNSLQAAPSKQRPSAA
jgi:glutaredoxin